MASIILDSNANRIQGDFSNVAVTTRTSLQSSTLNGSTGVYAIPNGSSTSAAWQAVNNSDPTNASKILIATNGSTDVQLVSGVNGSGTYLPLSFYNSGDVRFQVGTSGELGVRTGVGTVGYGTSGQVLTSAGTGASPTWSTPATPPGAMTLLGTITLTAANSVSLGSLVLTSYKSLFIVFNSAVMAAGAGTRNVYFSSNNQQSGGGFCGNSSANPTISGAFWLDLSTGAVSGSYSSNTPVPESANYGVGGITNVSTSSTIIYFRYDSTNTFTAAGSILVYGVS